MSPTRSLLLESVCQKLCCSRPTRMRYLSCRGVIVCLSGHSLCSFMGMRPHASFTQQRTNCHCLKISALGRSFARTALSSDMNLGRWRIWRFRVESFHYIGLAAPVNVVPFNTLVQISMTLTKGRGLNRGCMSLLSLTCISFLRIYVCYVHWQTSRGRKPSVTSSALKENHVQSMPCISGSSTPCSCIYTNQPHFFPKDDCVLLLQDPSASRMLCVDAVARLMGLLGSPSLAKAC